MLMKSPSKSSRVPRTKRHLVAKPVPLRTLTPTKPKIPLPPQAGKALQTMAVLARAIKDNYSTEYFGINIEVENGEWVLVFRGAEPLPIEYFGGYKVKFIKAVKSVGFLSG